MKIPAAKQLPSGAWNCVVMIDGQRISITKPTKKEAERAAAAMKSGAKAAARSPLTVGEAIDNYIASKDAVLSPSTIKGYKKIRRSAFQSLMQLHAAAMTSQRLQRAVNEMARTHSPKSVRNALGLFTAAMHDAVPEITFRVTLPQKEKPDIHIPTMDEVRILHEDCKGTDFELPFLLAVWLGLRTSEIRGLTWDCIKGNTIIIKQALVDGEEGPVLKPPKSFSGNRTLPLPQYIADLIAAQPRTNDAFITHFSRSALYQRLQRACKRCGIVPFRFHDLRHVNASVMLALGVPDKYAMERMGHATNNMLKNVYQHTMEAQSQTVANTVDNFFESQLQTELQTPEKTSA